MVPPLFKSFWRHGLQAWGYLFVEPVDGPLPLGGRLDKVVFSHGTLVAEVYQELDTLVGASRVVHVVRLDDGWRKNQKIVQVFVISELKDSLVRRKRQLRLFPTSPEIQINTNDFIDRRLNAETLSFFQGDYNTLVLV